jgi:hypothetical protein
MLVPELLREIIDGLSRHKIAKQAITENFPLLRTIRWVAQLKDQLFGGD